MRIIDVPEAIEIDMGIAPNGEHIKGIHTLYEVIIRALDMHDPFGNGVSNIMKAIKIHGEIKKAEKSGEKVIRLEDDHHESIKAALESAKWNPMFARQIGPFLDAVMNAQDVQDPIKK